jgi:IS5 family transposase
MTSAHGRGADHGAAAGKPCSGGEDRRDEAAGHAAGHRRHDGAAQERDVPDRRQAYPSCPRAAGTAGEEDGLDLRQSYVRIGKLALIKHQRYAHAKQFKRAGKALRKLKTYLGRIIRDISRQIAGDAELDAVFKWPLYQASTVLEQRQRQRGRKIYSLHAHEVECIGKGKAHAPYEFGVKVSIATTLKRSKGGQFALHAMALPGNPYDGHTLGTWEPSSPPWKTPSAPRSRASSRGRLPRPQRPAKPQVQGIHRRPEASRDAGHQTPDATTIRGRPVIGHIKNEHRMGRNHLAPRAMPSTPSWPPQATTPLSCSGG